jgi:predicted  nucleic acid-binding Zn-ribbon protein
MSDLGHTLTSLQSKIEKLVHLHKKAKDDIAKIGHEKDELEKVILEKDVQIAALEERIKVLKLAKTISSTNDNNITDIKYKINELVREIDKSIALLNR